MPLILVERCFDALKGAPFTEASAYSRGISELLSSETRFQEPWLCTDTHDCSAGSVVAARDENISGLLASPFQRLWSEVANVSPGLGRHPGLGVAALTAAGVAGGYYYSRYLLRVYGEVFDLEPGSEMLPVSRCANRDCLPASLNLTAECHVRPLSSDATEPI